MARVNNRAVVRVAVATALALILAPAGVASTKDELERKGSGYVQIIDKSFDVKAGGTLSLEAPSGSIKVKTWDKLTVHVIVERKVKTRSEEEAREILEDYPTTVEQSGNDIRIRTRSHSRWDDSDRIESSYRVTVPRRFNLDMETAGGSIEVDDLDGDVAARTAGGSIKVGTVTGEAELKTAGGSIKLKGGGTSTLAKTAGGSIEVGDANGEVIVETAGGSIKVGQAAGAIEAETAGGSIRLGPSGGDVRASTAGGSIRIAPADGAVRASTAGGSIAVDGSKGPVRASTSGGSIEVRDARAGVTAKTSGGSVTAELNVAKGADATTELETAGGDVTVYIPDNLSVTIEARIRRTKGGKYAIHSDFPIPGGIELTGDKARATLELGGGGDRIRLRTSQGDIYIKKLK
jgi:DUF4097 and DUF4098 domain-containing protein YvlB